VLGQQCLQKWAIKKDIYIYINTESYITYNTKSSKSSKYHPKSSKYNQKSSKSSKIIKNISKYIKIYQNLSKIIQNHQKSSKIYQNTSKFIKIYQKSSKIIKNHPNIYQNVSKYIKTSKIITTVWETQRLTSIDPRRSCYFASWHFERVGASVANGTPAEIAPLRDEGKTVEK